MILSHTAGDDTAFRKILETGYIKPRALMPESDALTASGYMEDLLEEEYIRNWKYAYFSILLDNDVFTTTVFPSTFILPTTILRGIDFYPQHYWTAEPDDKTRHFKTTSLTKINKALSDSTGLCNMSPSNYTLASIYANVISQVAVEREIPIVSALYVMLPSFATDDDIAATRRACPTATLMIKHSRILRKDMQIHRPMRVCVRPISSIHDEDAPLIIAAEKARLTSMDIIQFVWQVRVSGDAWKRAMSVAAKQLTTYNSIKTPTKDETVRDMATNIITTQIVGCLFDITYATRRFYPTPAAFTRFIRAALNRAKGDIQRAGYIIFRDQVAAKIADYIDGIIELHEIATRKIE